MSSKPILSNWIFPCSDERVCGVVNLSSRMAVRYRGTSGGPVRGEQRIIEARAAILRRIFRKYAAGDQPARHRATLQQGQHPSPRDKRWSKNTLRGHAKRGPETALLRLPGMQAPRTVRAFYAWSRLPHLVLLDLSCSALTGSSR